MTPEQELAAAVHDSMPSPVSGAFTGKVTAVEGGPISVVQVSADIGPIECRRWNSALNLPGLVGQDVLLQFVDGRPIIVCTLGS